MTVYILAAVFLFAMSVCNKGMRLIENDLRGRPLGLVVFDIALHGFMAIIGAMLLAT